MTKVKRMVVVAAWLRSGQMLLEYVDTVGLDVGTFLGWIMDYGQPAEASLWIPVRILDGSVDRYLLDAACSGEGLGPDRHAFHECRPQWIPVILQEYA